MEFWNGFWHALLIFDASLFILFALLIIYAYIYDKFFAKHIDIQLFTDEIIKAYERQQKEK